MTQTAVQFFDKELQKVMFIEYGELRGIIIPLEEYVRIKKLAINLEKEQHSKTWDTALDKYEVRAGNYMRAYEDFDDYFQEEYIKKIR